MPSSKRRTLEHTMVAIQQRHGARAIRPLRDLAAALPPTITTGFPALDAITGCGGIPCAALTLFSGPATSGKSTIAYKVLANAQADGALCALLDLTHTADPGYLERCGIALDRLLIVRPQPTTGPATDRVALLLDMVRSGRVRFVLVDDVAALTAGPGQLRQWNSALPRLRQLARAAGCAVLLLDQAVAPWRRRLNLDATAALRQAAALHIELRHERWLQREGQLVGYEARAELLRSLWRTGPAAAASAAVAIVFNGAVHARETW
jgi:recombination protein RecA